MILKAISGVNFGSLHACDYADGLDLPGHQLASSTDVVSIRFDTGLASKAPALLGSLLDISLRLVCSSDITWRQQSQAPPPPPHARDSQQHALARL